MTLLEGVEIQRPDDLNEGLCQGEQKGLNQAFVQSQSPLQEKSPLQGNQNEDSSADSSAEQGNQNEDSSADSSAEQENQNAESSAEQANQNAESSAAELNASRSLVHSSGDESLRSTGQQFEPLSLSSGDESLRSTDVIKDEYEGAVQEEDAAEKHWFVMRDLKRANAKLPAYKQFMEAKIEVFTPMHTILKTVKGRQRKVQEPFIRDLLFVHDTRETIDPIVEVTPTLQYRYERGKGYKVPMVVRDADMNRFILAVSTSKSTAYFTPNELNPSMIGRSVRITGGTLEGYTGKLLKISGSRAKRILVQLEGILAAGVEVDTQYLEVL